ncbi:hypothetical protein BDV95DRAFT_627111 [Massariosphaeria phaeospora]|uniref:Uncharacterized protein n=1 Tax=Massariosphaeria phaeospora TaxID=100035 RepID=A0A7C8IHM8_9PLEO|nr:hypothetical protein BDV95DRAFT_627111 [Massariosphaeria phaeospora]
MTRRVVYGLGLLFSLACTAMTIASIMIPRWVSYSPDNHRKISYGLHQHCSSVTGICAPFPKNSDCLKDSYFCSMWKSVGFLISFGVIIELCSLVSFIVVMSGGVQRRSVGWKIVCSLLLFGGIVQCAGMALVAFLFNNDDRFFEGWYLDMSWSLCTASWIILVLTGLGIAASAFYLSEEGGYELIPCNQMESEQDEQLQSRIAGWNDGYQQSRD